MSEAQEPRHLTFHPTFQRIAAEMRKLIVGQDEVIEGVLAAFFVGGHVLLEGVPGLGKTMLVRTLGEAVALGFARVQFTPDLMPADIIGTNVIHEDDSGRRTFQFRPGPVFTHLLLADEINRATPKTQSALLEAMQEQRVTVGGQSHALPQPFLVLATQNPLEMEGTYPLPEAQLDRFLFKIKVPYPDAESLHTILERTTAQDAPRIHKVLGTAEGGESATAREVLALREIVRAVPVVREVQEFAVKLVLSTHPDQAGKGSMAQRFVRYGASPRGAQALILAAKVFALLDGRYHVAKEDIAKAALPALRHRVIVNFEGEAEGIQSDSILADCLAALR